MHSYKVKIIGLENFPITDYHTHLGQPQPLVRCLGGKLETPYQVLGVAPVVQLFESWDVFSWYLKFFPPYNTIYKEQQNICPGGNSIDLVP